MEWSEATGATFLAPNKVQPKPIPVVFDVHAHLFNATDVPVRGFLAGPVAHSLNPPLDNLVSAAAPIIEELSQLFAISCGEEMQILSEKLTRAKGMSGLSVNHDLRAEVDRDLERHLSKIKDQLERRLPGSDFGDKLDDAYRKYEMSRRKLSSGRTPSTGATLVSRSPDFIRAGLTQGVNPSLSVKGKSTEEKASDNLNPLGVLSLLRYMLTPRYLNLRAFQKAYSEDAGAFGVDCCFAALVDFDHWLGCAETSSSLHDQVLLHEQLAVLSGGYVLPLLPSIRSRIFVNPTSHSNSFSGLSWSTVLSE